MVLDLLLVVVVVVVLLLLVAVHSVIPLQRQSHLFVSFNHFDVLNLTLM